MRWFALGGLLLTSCLGGGDAARKENARLERQLEELRRRTDHDRQAVHELENRIFILEDKLDTAQVAQGMTRSETPPRLPVVTKAPAPQPSPVVDEEPAAAPVDDGGPPVVIRMDARTRAPVRLDRRDLDAVDEKLPVAPLPKNEPLGNAARAGAAMDEYQRAYQALGRREHATAIAGFRAFLAAHPQHDYADNAQYWLGEAYYDQADYATALAEFRAVLKRYPGGNKAPDALLKVGFCLTKLGDAGAASDVLGQVVEIYPKTDAARLAVKRLDEIRRAR